MVLLKNILGFFLLSEVLFLEHVGLLTAVHRDYFRVINHRDLLLNDIGDRVAQLLHVELVNPFFLNRSTNVRQEILIVNTHLLFPHDSSLCLVRLHQVCGIPNVGVVVSFLLHASYL